MNKKEALKQIKAGNFSLADADERLKADKEVVLEVVKSYGYDFQYADKSLKKDKEIVLIAVKFSGDLLQYADEKLKADKEVVLEAVKNYGGLQYADKSLKKDKEIVLEAVKSSGSALEYADNKLKADKEIVLEAVKQNGSALEYTDNSLKKDKEVVLIAVKQSGSALEYADESLKKDKEIVLVAVKQQDGLALQYADNSLKKDKEVVHEAVKNFFDAKQYADKSLREYVEANYLEYVLKGSELNYDYVTVNLKEINSNEKLTKYLLDFIKNPPDQGTSHLVLGRLESEDKDPLLSNWLSIEDSDGNQVDDILIKNINTGKLIKPKKDHAVLVFFYYYDHGLYKLNTYKKINDIYLETKQFYDKAIITKTDYSDFEIRAEEASGGGAYRYKIIFEDNYTFEGSGKEWIEEVSEHLKNIGIIK